MPITLLETLRRNRLLIGALVAIGLIVAIPVPTPTVSYEENPDDSVALPLSKDTPIKFHLDDVSPVSSAITFWIGDVVKAPLTTVIDIQVENEEMQHLRLSDLPVHERKITIPLPTLRRNSLEITLSTSSLELKKAINFRTQQHNKETLAYILYEKKPIVTVLLKYLYSQKGVADDIEYVWSEGAAITNGVNPYAKSANGLPKITKHATYFPIPYLASAAIQKLGFMEFEPWLNIVRPIVFISQLITALAVLVFLYTKKQLTLGIFGFFIILFHRFTLYPARVAHIDFPAIAFLILGLLLLSRKPKIAYLLIGISLATKQMAIFIIPLILIWAWQRYQTKRQVILACVLTFLIPTIVLAPFVISSPSGTINSIVYSANRASTGDFSSPDISSLLSLEGFTARIPMAGLMILVFVAFWRKELGLFAACLAVFTVFIGFNPALFFQYLAWIIPFILLAISERTTKTTKRVIV